METLRKFIKSVIEVSHIEFQSYSLEKMQMIYTSGLSQKVLGYTSNEFEELSRNFYEEIIHPDDKDVLHEKIGQLIITQPGEVVEMTARYKRADGEYITAYMRKMVTEWDKYGNPSVIVTVAEDISNLVKLQEDLKVKVENLDLISWQNSHLINGPVVSIIGLVNLIEEEEITSPHNKQVFEYIKQVLEKLNKVIRLIIAEADRHYYEKEE